MKRGLEKTIVNQFITLPNAAYPVLNVEPSEQIVEWHREWKLTRLCIGIASQSGLDFVCQCSEIRDSLQLIIRQFHVEVMLKTGQ